MSSLTISHYNDLGKSDEDKARILAKRYGLFAVVRYKNDSNASKFTDFGTCENSLEVEKYLNSPHCHEAEVIYRSSNSPIKLSYHTPIIDAIEKLSDDKDLINVVQLLIYSGASVNVKSNSDWTALHEAAKIGDDDIASLLISHGADTNAANDSYMYTPLHIAAHYGNLNVFKLLVSNGADTNLSCNDGGKAIHIAADGDKINIIDYLLKQGYNADEKGKKGNSPLHSAVGKNNQETVNFLISNGADINFQNDFGITPLHYAAFFNQPDMVRILLKHGADENIIDHEGNTPLLVAETNNNMEVVKYLSEFNQKSGTSAEVEVDQQNYHPTVIHYRQMARDLIKQHGPLKRVEYLSHFPKFEINFVFEKRTVYSGERRGEYDIHFLSLGYVGEGPRYARFFLDEAGFSISSDEIDAIRPGAIIELRDDRVVVSYPEKATDTDSETDADVALEDDITLHKAIIQEDAAKVRALITRGDNIQAVDNDGATPLHYAAYIAHTEIAEILLENGALVDAKNAKGQTPLHEVASHLHREGDEATMAVLLDAGASLSVRGNDGATPLHAAAIGGHFEAAKMLLDRGADIQARAQQLTPLHFSAYAGKPEVTQLLIERGADVFAEKDGMTPLYMAQQPSHSTESGKRAVVQMLEQAMAGGKRKAQPTTSTRAAKSPSRVHSEQAATHTEIEVCAPVIQDSEQSTNTAGKQQNRIISIAAIIVLSIIAAFLFASNKNKRPPATTIVQPIKKEGHSPVTVSTPEPKKMLEEISISAQLQPPKIMEQTRQTETQKENNYIGPALKTPVVSQTSYHVIVGSFKNKTNAVNYAKSLKDRGYSKCSVLFYDNRNLVSIESFKIASQARLKKKEVLNNNGLESWIFTKSNE